MSSNTKNILFVITQGHWGGAQRYVFDLARNYTSRGHKVKVAVGDEPNQLLQQRLTTAGIPVHQLSHLVRPVNPVQDFAAVFELRRLIARGGYDVVHLNSSKAGVIGSIAAAIIPRRTRPAIIYTAHGWVFVEPLSSARRWVYRILERITAPAKNIIVCVSQQSKDDALAAHVGNKEQMVVIPIGLDRNDLEFLPHEQARAELCRLAHITDGPDVRIAVTIANYYATKGIDLLLTAWPRVLERHPDAHAIVLGDGPLGSELKHQLVAEGIGDKFHLPGAVPDAYRLLMGADLFVLPSRKEGLPYALLEAQAAGLPIVASEVGGIPAALANGRGGLLIPPGAPGDIAAAVITLLNDSQLGQRLATATRATHTLANMAEATLACYARRRQENIKP
jgi:glycosyltransferase involved in cell wall biosynthesis